MKTQHMHDLVIQNANVVDGLGNEPVAADVAVSNGRFTACLLYTSDAADE